MDCFSHHDAPAVGVCKNCHKGVCVACAVDVGNGIACRGECEARVVELNELTERSRRIQRHAGQMHGNQALVMALLGILFVVFGFLMRNSPLYFFIMPSGLIFLLGSIFMYSARNRMWKS